MFAYLALALTTFATLLLEVVDGRFLSVVTWYHLSFLAISVAMLGMAAAAVAVFALPDRFPADDAATLLARWATRFAWSIPLSHLLSLAIPVPTGLQWTVMDVVALAVALAVLTAPFALSGVVTTLALTRSRSPVRTLYAVDLAGAALGCLGAVLLLEQTNLSAAVFAAAGAAGVAALCYRLAAGGAMGLAMPALALSAVVAAAANTGSEGVHVLYPKNRQVWTRPVLRSLWNSHAHVLVFEPRTEPAHFWGGGIGSEAFQNDQALVLIDGEAGTPLTQWDGNPDSLEWASFDVTSLPYHLRKGGRAAVIGVGGGRDILAALWGRSASVTAVEINNNLVALLDRYYRRYTRIADQSNVTLIHDEGRSFLTRTPARFDVLQMSLVDTWAATGAGAFTLSENGLYTREAWGVFLDRLTPHGILSVSRWFSPGEASETSRLLALAVGALLDRGVQAPQQHLALIARHNVATLLASPEPLSEDDLRTIDAVSQARGFRVLVSPATPADHPMLDAIVRSRSDAQLRVAVADPMFDYAPPTDSRPFFFNVLKPAAWLHPPAVPDGGVIAGNLRATATLVAILGVAVVFVLGAVALPLALHARPNLSTPSLAAAVLYFATIGGGFLGVQIGFLQRFSVLLGHPTYSLVVVLFSMILAAGLGSAVSERLLGPGGRRFPILMLALAVGLATTAGTIAQLCAVAVAWPLAWRIAVVIAVIFPISALMGVCFPHGAALVRAKDQATLAWMWGANGGVGVVASILAVIVSMAWGIEANLWLAAAAYASLPLVARLLAATEPQPAVAHDGVASHRTT